MFKNLLFTLLIICGSIQGQNIKGYVYDQVTKQPIELASVYFNNTTLGTVTDEAGYFEIAKPEMNTDLVISFIGYEDNIIKRTNVKNSLKAFLVKATNELATVNISYKDSLSRRKKIELFRHSFLGVGNRSKCKIKNEKDLILKFNSANKTLKVKAKKPIVIVNKILGYQLEFSLNEFIAQYRIVTMFEGIKILSDYRIMYYGNTKFNELSKKKKYQQARVNAYLGSKLHFMRSLYADKLKENTFGFIEKGVIVKPEMLVTQKFKKKTAYVETKKDTLQIAYYPEMNVILQSTMIVESKEFKIDQFGNSYSDPMIMFSGFMGSQKVSQMLPLDYSVSKE